MAQNPVGFNRLDQLDRLRFSAVVSARVTRWGTLGLRVLARLPRSPVHGWSHIALAAKPLFRSLFTFRSSAEKKKLLKEKKSKSIKANRKLEFGYGPILQE
jgi:hypothetical protein